MHLKLLLSLIFLAAPSVVHAQEWYAMARHGECVDLVKLNDRSNLVRGATTPREMEDMMINAGVAYTIEPLIQGEEGMLKLNVPSQNWAMILVKKQFCQEFLER